MEWITPNWPVPNHVHALTTLRFGGYSQGSYESLNLALHVEDDQKAVEANRRLLMTEARLPSEPVWLTQVHGTKVINTNELEGLMSPPEADASFSFTQNKVCAILSADCLPILLCDEMGTSVAAIHAGWRGLAAGVIEATVKHLEGSSQTLMAWLGPSIGPEAFEVGKDVLLAFGESAEPAFKVHSKTTWKANLYELATLRLKSLGITRIFGGGFCTFTDKDRFFSFRRSLKTGRMATLIWLS